MLLCRSFPSLFLVILLLVSPLSYSASAQDSAAAEPPAAVRVSFHGQVLDPTRAPIRGARILAIPEDGRRRASTVSDQHGEFTLALDAGRHTITVAADGFLTTTYAQDGAPTGLASREFVLEVAGVRETVHVSPPPSYQTPAILSGTKTPALLRDVPQAITVINKELIRDQLMLSLSDVVRYVPGITAQQGENNRDQVVIRGNSSSADFFLDGVRDDGQRYRDLYNVDRVEALKGPNAMIFGRGGGGGVINRVSKEAGPTPFREVTLLGGAFGAKRLTTDFNQPMTGTAAFRINAMYEDSDSFRQAVNLKRLGVNPTLTVTPDSRTRITLAYEHFRDDRVADRGIPSFQGLPVTVGPSTYFGDPADSYARARVDLLSVTVDRRMARLHLRNRTLVGDYERAYQNFVPGAVNAVGTHVSLSAYNNDVRRLNLFNQTDLTFTTVTGRVRHTWLGGAEIGRQATTNFRQTGYFNNIASSILLPMANPAPDTPVTFRQSATDADNRVRASVAAIYAQDQIEVSRFVHVLAGLRVDSFDLGYHNNRTGDEFDRADLLISPRAGLVIKPATALSVYGSYSVSYLPSSGDQFSSLTAVTEQVKPEKFSNYELGAKWDVGRALALTTAVYRLDRTNTRATDPNDPTRIVQTGSQRTNGFEFGVGGHVTPAWQIAGGYAYQHAFVTSATAMARDGAQVAQVPRHTFSLWNAYQVLHHAGVGLGVVRRTDMFAAIDNTVTLPAYTGVDAAVFVTLTARMRVQANVENLFDRTYYPHADGNANISPGSPRAVRVQLIASF